MYKNGILGIKTIFLIVYLEQKLGNEARYLHSQIYYTFMLCIYNLDLYTSAPRLCVNMCLCVGLWVCK